MREVHARKNRSPPEKATPFEQKEVQEEVQTIPSSMNFRIVEGTMLNPHDDDASDGLSFLPKRVESKAFSMQSSSSRRKSDPKRLFKNVQIVNADQSYQFKLQTSARDRFTNQDEPSSLEGSAE